MDTFEIYKANQKKGWANFAPVEMMTAMPAARLVKHAGVRPEQIALDVACGTGVIAVTAARLGAKVSGLDLTPELLERARYNSALAQVNIDWHEGDVEQLPFSDAQFDVVLSQFGHIFAPRPALAVSEMLRVLKPGGTIAFSTWPPQHFVGRSFALMAKYMPPPPPGIVSPILWGDEKVVRERLGGSVRDLTFDTGTMSAPALSPRHHRAANEKVVGRLIELVQALSVSDPARLAEFRGEAEALTAEYFAENFVRQDFLMSRAIKV